VVLTGAVASIVGIFVLVGAVETTDVGLITLGYVLGFGVLYCIGYGAQPSVYAGAFDARVRYTGMSLGFQLATVLGSAVGPGVSAIILRTTGQPFAVAAYVGAMLVISLVCLAVLTRRPRPVAVPATPSGRGA
jgi:hypothetical protein